MRLRALRLWNVRRFGDQGVAIEGIADGVSVLAAPNEAGKSTAFDALHALFFLPHGSAAQAARDLRPYSGGSPRIEAEVETATGRLRITKQYFKGSFARVADAATGRLIAQADEAEALIAGLVAGGAGGPAGLLWVRQGVTGMGGGTPGERAEERRAREDVLTSVAGGEVEALTGGRRMVRILARCAEDLDRLATTTGRPKANGPWAEALAEVERLAKDEASVAGDLATLARDLDARRRARARLADLADPAAEAARHDAAARTARALDAARAHAARLSAAETAEALATERARAAAAARDSFAGHLARAAALSATLAEAETAQARAQATRMAADADATAADADLRAAEAAAAAARAALDAARKDARARDAAGRLSELTARLARAEDARRRAEDKTAEARALAVPAATFDALDALERRIAGLRAARDAATATIAIAYAPGAEGRVRCDGQALAAGTHPVPGPLALDLDGIGRITVSPGRHAGADPAAGLAAAETERHAMLAALGADSLVALRAREVRAAEARQAAGAAGAELAALAPDGLDALRLRIGELQALAAPAGAEPADPEAAEAALAPAEDRLRAARSAQQTARACFDTARDAALTATHSLERAREALAAVEAALGPADGRETARAALDTAARTAAAELAAARATAAHLRADAPDLASVEAAATRAATAVTRARDEAGALDREIAELTGRIAARADEAIEERHEELRGRLAAARTRLAHVEAEVAALTRLRRALDEARRTAREQYFGPVMAELRPLLALLLDEASITFDDATLLPAALARAGQEEEVDRLSGGLREQLAVLTRLAFARLLARGGQPVPVILDDALVWSDDARIERMFDALHRQARDLQIIVLTCRQRAFEGLGGQGLRMADWRPDA